MKKIIEFKSENGRVRGKISGNLKDPRIGLICLHGGPGGDFHGNTNVFDDIANVASQLDCCTLQYSVFGAEPSDGAPEDISISTQISDLSAAISYFCSKFSCSIYLVGESAGATIVSQSWDSLVQGYILLWPAFDLADTDLNPYISGYWKEEADREGAINDNGVILGKQMIDQINATDFSLAFNLPAKPILIAHGQKDEEVPYLQSLRAIQTAKDELIFLSHPNAGHGFKTTEQRNLLLMYIETWLRARLSE